MSAWSDFLRARGASFDAARVSDFGDAAGELAAARDSAVLCELSPIAVVAVTGADAATFLQGQLTSDLAQLEDGASQLSAWCTAKGRVLANFLVRRLASDHFELLLPASLSASAAKRLRMYVLRAKVDLADVSDRSARLGLGGPAAAACIAATIGVTPPMHHSMAIDGGSLMALADRRFLIVVAPERAQALWSTFDSRARAAGSACWEWLTIQAGVPVITPATQDAFIPQMLNLDALGALAFDKGCYTGQEIVARTQYLGRLKERLARAHVDATPPLPGTRLYSPAFGEQPCGTVVNAAAAPNGGAEFLAVAQTAALSAHALRLGAQDGPLVAILPLPYALPMPGERSGRTA